jgi:DNA adenine methylase
MGKPMALFCWEGTGVARLKSQCVHGVRMRSFLRWAGSKKQLLPVLEKYWRDGFSRYIEPFAGSSCLFFHLEPQSAILGDINGELIGAMRAIRLDARKVIECLRRLPKTKESYYRIRRLQPSRLGLFEGAARFLYLNSLCFNGLYRTNTSGLFNVPYCPPGHKTVPEDLIIEASLRLRSTRLVCGDFEETVALATTGDFVYLDPPYAVSRRRIFSEYGPTIFQVEDLDRLDGVLSTLDERGVKFVVSYADCAEARSTLKKWVVRRVWTKRNIAGFTGHRRGSYELLATNLDN